MPINFLIRHSINFLIKLMFPVDLTLDKLNRMLLIT